MRIRACVAISVWAFCGSATGADSSPWNRHTVDNSSQGADGVRLGDVNGDGLPDITTGWEQGGVVRVYRHPGYTAVRSLWPRVEVGPAPAVEDAVFADLDADGRLDVLSASEGREQSLQVHWAPRRAGAPWTTTPIPAAKGATRWMFSLPMDVDGRHGIDWVAGSKDPDAAVGFLLAPENARDVAAWRWVPQYGAGWIMSLRAADIDGDGDDDILVSDRKGPRRGVLWLENLNSEHVGNPMSWPKHRVGPVGSEEVMFLDYADINGDGDEDVAVAVKDGPLVIYLRKRQRGWERIEISLPSDMGSGKAVAIGDIDGDGSMDLVVSCEHAESPKSGLRWVAYSQATPGKVPYFHAIAGTEGVKFDRIELVDLDGDGDLDVLTCEEVTNLGVIWYENPLH